MGGRSRSALNAALVDAEVVWTTSGRREDYEVYADIARRSQATVGRQGLIEHLQRRMHAASESGDAVALRQIMLALCDELERNGEALAKEAMNDMLAQR